jgi:hypothetical protein
LASGRLACFVFLLAHRFHQTPAKACVWIDVGYLFAHRFYQTPARAFVWIDAAVCLRINLKTAAAIPAFAGTCFSKKMMLRGLERQAGDD